MTISTTTSVITYQGNGVTTVFTFPFVADVAADIEVIYTDAAGTQTTLATNQYTLVINAPAVGQIWGVGGSVTYPTSGTPIATGTYITINRIVPYTQTTTLTNQGSLYPQTMETGLDVLELELQQVETSVGYAIKMPIVDTAHPNDLPVAALRANGYLGFDSSGQPTVIVAAPSIVPVSSVLTRKISTTGTAVLTLLASDALGGVSIYQTGPATTTIQLPTGYGPFPVFDGGLNAATYPITVLPPAGLTIQGATSYILTFNGQSATFYNDGTQILIG